MALMVFLFHAKDKTKSKKVWNYIRVKKKRGLYRKIYVPLFFYYLLFKK